MNTITNAVDQGRSKIPITGLTLKNSEFQKVRKMIHNYCGIYINEGKEALVQSRLMKRIRKLGMGSFDEYLKFVEQDTTGGEFLSFVDVLTTNKTNFFRESKHFEFIQQNVLPKIGNRSVKWWSAGCSSGEEPITCAITLLEASMRAKILATDISRDVLQTAKQGIYSYNKTIDVPDRLLDKYFSTVGNDSYRVSDQIRKMITYGRLNLTDKWPLKGDFQIIMCRNVMIYFNRETQEDIVRKFHSLLEPGGYLFLGHSESINAAALGFKNVAPAVYQKL